MNKYFIGLLATALIFLASCTNDEFNSGNRRDGLVDFTIKTSIPQGIKTYASENGGATNVIENQYDLRYILEVWTKEATPRLAFRDYKTVSADFTSTSVTFSARLLALDYDFVFWADFVNEGTNVDLYYKTNNGSTDPQIKADPTIDPGLRAIEMLSSPAYNVSNDARDAFYAVKNIDLTTTDASEDITLYRPFGKYRLVATDAADGYLADAVMKTKISYKHKLPYKFNALTGEVDAATINIPDNLLTSVGIKETITAGGNTYNDALILGFDYIFASAAQTVSFEVTSFKDAAASEQIGLREIPNIPIRENKLTTIIGNFYTNTGTVNVIVENDFDGETDIDLTDKIKIGSIGYPTIDAALAAATSNDVIEVPAGSFDIRASVITIPAGVTIRGAGKDATVIVTTEGVSIDGTLDNVWVKYNVIRTPGEAWGVNPQGVALKAGGTLSNSRVSGFRNGVYANNVTNITISDNEILQNRTGIQLANGVTGTISNNIISDNETIGILSQPISGGVNSGNIPSITGNTITGNWSSDFENRWGSTYVIDLNGNTFSNGTKTISIAASSGEGSSSSTFTKNSVTFRANIVTTVESNITLTGATVWNTIKIGSTSYLSLAAALAAASSTETITLSDGTWTEEITVKADVTIAGNGDKTVLKGYIKLSNGSTLKDVKVDCSAGSSPRTAIYALDANVTIENINLVYTGSYASKEAILVAADGFTLKNSFITGFRKGMYIHPDLANIEIKDNEFLEVNPFSTDGYHSSITVTGNTFNRGIADESWRSPHIIVTDTDASSANPENWSANLKNTVNQILNNNTWQLHNDALGEGYPLKAIRIQNTSGSTFDTYISSPI
jgi:parallel beta-helix repeat protein